MSTPHHERLGPFIASASYRPPEEVEQEEDRSLTPQLSTQNMSTAAVRLPESIPPYVSIRRRNRPSTETVVPSEEVANEPTYAVTMSRAEMAELLAILHRNDQARSGRNPTVDNSLRTRILNLIDSDTAASLAAADATASL